MKKIRQNYQDFTLITLVLFKLRNIITQKVDNVFYSIALVILQFRTKLSFKTYIQNLVYIQAVVLPLFLTIKTILCSYNFLGFVQIDLSTRNKLFMIKEFD